MRMTTRLISLLAAAALVIALSIPLLAVVPRTVNFRLHDSGALITDAQMIATRQNEPAGTQTAFAYDDVQYYVASLKAPATSSMQNNTYTIDVHHDRYESTQYTLVLEFDGANRPVTVDCDISAYRQCRVDVTAVDQSGNPVGDVLVDIGGATGVTDGVGACGIKTRQNPAPVAVVVTPPGGYEYHGADMVSLDGDTAQLNLILEKTDAATIVIDLSGSPAADIRVGGDGITRVTGRDAGTAATYNGFPVEVGTVIGVSGTGSLSVSGYTGMIHTENNVSITTFTGNAHLYTPAGCTIAVGELNSALTLSGPGHRRLGPVSTAGHLYTVSAGTADYVGNYPGATVVDGGTVTVASGVSIGDRNSGTDTVVDSGSLVLEGGAVVGGDLTVGSAGRLDLAAASQAQPVRFTGGAGLVLTDGAVLLTPESVAAIEDIQNLLQGSSLQLDAVGSAVTVQTADGRAYRLTGGDGGLQLARITAGGSPEATGRLSTAGSSGGSGSAAISSGSSSEPVRETSYSYNAAGDLVISIPEPATRLGFVRADLLPGGTTESRTRIPADSVVVREVSGGVEVRLKADYLAGLEDGPYAVRAVFLGGAFQVRFDLESTDKDQDVPPPFREGGEINANPRTGP